MLRLGSKLKIDRSVTVLVKTILNHAANNSKSIFSVPFLIVLFISFPGLIFSLTSNPSFLVPLHSSDEVHVLPQQKVDEMLVVNWFRLSKIKPHFKRIPIQENIILIGAKTLQSEHTIMVSLTYSVRDSIMLDVTVNFV